jgi:hypothetical protein
MFRKDSQICLSEHFKIFLNNKRNLFLVSSIVFVAAIIYPIILPHIHHPSMIHHIVIHIIIFEVSLFLTLISIYSYKKTKSKKILFTALSFGFLLIAGFLYLLETSNILVGFHSPYIEAEIPHILLMFMLILFAIGVLKVESK